MSIIEGGAFDCGIHNFKTESVDEWNKHCTEELHTESGVTHCTSCNEIIEFEDLPYKQFGPDGRKNVQLMCEDCQKATMGSGKVRKLHKND